MPPTLMESKKSLQKDAPDKFHEKIFQELKELEEKAKEALELLGQAQVGKIEEGKGSSQDATGGELPVAEGDFTMVLRISSSCSCSPSVAQDVDEEVSTPSRRPFFLGKERDWWSADLEGEIEKLAVEGSFSVTTGGSMNPDSKADHWSTRTVLTKEENEGVKGAENERQEMEVDKVIPGTQPSNNGANGGLKMYEVDEQQTARVEVQAQKEELYVQSQKKRKTMSVKGLLNEDFSQEETDEIGFVPSALSEPRGAIHWCDNRCIEKALRYMQIAPMVTEGGGEARTINV